jgi:hypothetical protein
MEACCGSTHNNPGGQLRTHYANGKTPPFFLAALKRMFVLTSNSCRALTAGVIVAGMCCVFCCTGQAHDIPNDITVQVFIKPTGKTLELLVRVPLKAMRDVDFPEDEKGYLNLSRIDSTLNEAANLWIADAIDVYEEDVRLPKPRVAATQISLESDKSFSSFDEAVTHIVGPRLSANTKVYWDQTLLDVLFEYPAESDQSRFSIQPRLSGLAVRVLTVLRFVAPGGSVRAFEYLDDPGLVRLDPRWYQASLRFVNLGFFHILDGTDHLLFLFCLVIPLRRFAALIPVVTSFTVAHSITLIASAYDLAPSFLWFPPLIETLIAISIVYMALENIAATNSVQRRWMITFGFGLVHGFGFSFALREALQFAGSHLLTSLLSFNLGVELGQLLVLALLVPALELLFRFVVAERMGTIMLSALIAHTSWHWLVERTDRLRQYPFKLPALTAAQLATISHWIMLALIVTALIRLMRTILRQRLQRTSQGKVAPTP